MKYITVTAAALLLGLSTRRVRLLASQCRIKGAKLINPRCYLIPDPPVVSIKRAGRPKNKSG